ncbi:related to HNM1 - Choline permease [Cephalotrichum gorgonifer]|uniref:Related to HNM1 - Choline permease n=1 Tax=Cephalotrichum gorgonifer TaxID=2041049 RepID=A0AAE8N4M1_9PEZI|nr:related to HNM1 - Choline permease [Cephalotrichum gorgonifer]
MGIGLISGGAVSLVYGFILSLIGNLCIAMSLSEPASMYPNSGGQYYMISKLSSPRYKALLSWYTGWVSLIGWLGLTASAPFGAANLIQGLITLNHETYEPKSWHWYLIYSGVTIGAFMINTWGGKVLPMVENVIMIFHVVFFFAILIATAALPNYERQSPQFVFTYFSNGTGWESNVIAWGIGMLTSAYIMVGYDSAIHMSEEMQKPETGVPKAMISSLFVNGIMGLAVLISILFGIADLNTALNSKTKFPIIEIFYQMTRGNKAAASAMTCTVIASASLATVGLLASTSRTLWSFARDGAPPCSGSLSQVSGRHGVPFNAVAVSTIVLILLGLLYIASTTAFNAILSIAVVGLSLSYLVPVAAMLYRRIHTPSEIRWGPWRMPGGVGIAINVASICYILFLTAFLALPTVKPVTAQNMNYASLLLGGVLFLVTIDWVFRGRKYFEGPKPMF